MGRWWPWTVCLLLSSHILDEPPEGIARSNDTTDQGLNLLPFSVFLFRVIWRGDQGASCYLPLDRFRLQKRWVQAPGNPA